MSGLYLYNTSFLKTVDATRFFPTAGFSLQLLTIKMCQQSSGMCSLQPPTLSFLDLQWKLLVICCLNFHTPCENKRRNSAATQIKKALMYVVVKIGRYSWFNLFFNLFTSHTNWSCRALSLLTDFSSCYLLVFNSSSFLISRSFSINSTSFSFIVSMASRNSRL